MNRVLQIGISTLFGLGLGILLSYALAKQKEDNDTDTDTTEHDSYDPGKVKPKKRPSTPRKPVKRHVSKQRWENWLKNTFHRFQVTITNTATEPRIITLWGANNSSLSVSPPHPADVEDHTISSAVTIPAAIGVGIQPQGIAVNPVNGYGYVANQLSNNVSVITPAGGLVTLIQLQPSNLPGSNSPVAVAVNTRPDSPNYGTVYVAGSVADTISVIDLGYTITNEIATGPRPVDVAFNPVNENLYVANLAGDTVTVIDTNTETVSATLAVGSGPLAIGINPTNGDIYVGNSADNSVTVFDQGDNLVTTIAGVGVRPVSITYHPVNDLMYVVGSDSNDVTPIDTSLYTTLAPIAAGNSPGEIIYNTNNDFLYLVNGLDNTITVIAPDNSIRATLTLGNVNFGLAINQSENILFASDTANNTVNVIGYNDQSNSIIVSDNYQELAEDTQHVPALVKHVKFVLSGQERFDVLTLREESVTGRFDDTPLSLGSYNNPQNRLNAYEVFGMDGEIISGLHSWIFQIAGEQTISLLVYFKQLDTYSLLTNNSIPNLNLVKDEKDRLFSDPKHPERRKQKHLQRRYYNKAHRPTLKGRVWMEEAGD